MAIDYAKLVVDSIRQPALDRTERFMVRVETHLAGLPEAEHAPFLRAQLRKWRCNYVAWAARIDSCTASEVDLRSTAFDWVETIAALNARLAKAPAGAEQPESADA